MFRSTSAAMDPNDIDNDELFATQAETQRERDIEK